MVSGNGSLIVVPQCQRQCEQSAVVKHCQSIIDVGNKTGRLHTPKTKQCPWLFCFTNFSLLPTHCIAFVSTHPHLSTAGERRAGARNGKARGGGLM